ncbi:MAG: N-formylglutamate amidohydrolase [Caldilineaceae bacterium]|nr:N-formylglutamate amidohydrolase [Caldilineaceae bacterium]
MTIPPPTIPLPIVQSIPHAGLDAPTEMQDQLLVDATTIYNECDLWADQLYDFAHADLQPWRLPGYAPGVLATVSAPIARVFVDANRERDDLDNPDGPIKTQTSYGELIYRAEISIEQKRALRDRYWQPFHHQLAAALATHAGQVGLLLDCHNMAQRGPAAYAFAGAAPDLPGQLGGRKGRATSRRRRNDVPRPRAARSGRDRRRPLRRYDAAGAGPTLSLSPTYRHAQLALCRWRHHSPPWPQHRGWRAPTGDHG